MYILYIKMTNGRNISLPILCHYRCDTLRYIATRRFGKLRYLAALKRQHVSTATLPCSPNSKRFAGLEFENGESYSEHRQ